MNEFELIKHFFADTRHISRTDVLTGIGDDAARVHSQHAVITTNLLLQEQIDFQPNDAAASIGHMLMARTLTLLIAQGAQPAWAMLSLSMPKADSSWLEAFSEALLQIARLADVQLIGGDTTRSPNIRLLLSCHGLLPREQSVQAHQPKPGDLIYVVGSLGDNSLAILALQEEIHLPTAVKRAVLDSLYYPAPPLGLDKILATLPVLAFPLTTGLYASLDEVVNEACCGASLYVDQLPCDGQVESRLQQLGGRAMLSESPQPCTLAMIVPSDQQALFEQSVTDCGYCATWVGVTESLPEVRLVD